MAKFQYTETGQFVTSPVGTHVTYQYQGQTLIGTVAAIRINTDEGERMRVFQVKHFNGEPWPVEPSIHRVDVLERDWKEVAE